MNLDSFRSLFDSVDADLKRMIARKQANSVGSNCISLNLSIASWHVLISCSISSGFFDLSSPVTTSDSC